MTVHYFSRRAMILSSITGVGVATTAAAQQPIKLSVDPERIRSIHRSELEGAAKRLGSTLALSREGIDQSINNLVEIGVLRKDENSVLQSFLDAIFNSKSLEEIQERVDSLVSKTFKLLGEAGKAIVAVISDSVEYAREVLSGMSIEKSILIIAYDVGGAIAGGGAGAAIGSAIPGLGNLAGAVAGIVGGGVSASIIGFFDHAKRDAG